MPFSITLLSPSSNIFCVSLHRLLCIAAARKWERHSITVLMESLMSRLWCVQLAKRQQLTDSEDGVTNLVLYVPPRQTFDMALTDNKASDENHGVHYDKSSINEGPGQPWIHNDSMILVPNSSHRNISDERMAWQSDSLRCNLVNLSLLWTWQTF